MNIILNLFAVISVIAIFLGQGANKKRNIALVFMLWTLGWLIMTAASVSSPGELNINVADISKGYNSMAKGLINEIPLPHGQFCVTLPTVDQSMVAADGSVIVLTLPSALDRASLAISVELLDHPYRVVRPEMTKVRKKVFNTRVKAGKFILDNSFPVNNLVSFKPIVSQGRMGYEARLKGDNIDKLYIELYEDSRRIVFEIAVSKAVLTLKHRNLLRAVASSVEDYKKYGD